MESEPNFDLGTLHFTQIGDVMTDEDMSGLVLDMLCNSVNVDNLGISQSDENPRNSQSPLTEKDLKESSEEQKPSKTKSQDKFFNGH